LVTIPEQNRDPELSAKIIQNELPGVFNWVLTGLRRLLTQKRFTYSAEVENTIRDYRQQSDTVQLFIEDEMYVPSLVNYQPLKLLYQLYRRNCLDIGQRPCTMRAFPERLKKHGFETGRKNTGTVVHLEKKTA